MMNGMNAATSTNPWPEHIPAHAEYERRHSMNKTESLTPQQVHVIVQELRSADYQKEGDAFFLSRVNRLNAAGWILGVLAYSHKLHKGRKGNPLRHPRYEWRNTAYFFNVSLKTRVFYWDNDGNSKQHAQDLALRQPAPKLPHGQYFITFNQPTTGTPEGAGPAVVGTHTGQRVANRGACEKCNTPTNWVVDVSGRSAYWCGCGN